MDRTRLAREDLWRVAQADEEIVCEPYIRMQKASPTEFLERLNEQVQIILQTNIRLEEELSTYEKNARELKKQRDAKQHEWDAIQRVLNWEKELESEAQSRLRKINVQGLTDECCLREQNAAILDRLATVIRENNYLEEKRKEETRQIEKQNDVMSKLQRELDKLELRVAEFQLDDDDVGYWNTDPLAAGESNIAQNPQFDQADPRDKFSKLASSISTLAAEEEIIYTVRKNRRAATAHPM